MIAGDFQFRRRAIGELLLRRRHRELWFSNVNLTPGRTVCRTGVGALSRPALRIERQWPRAMIILASNARHLEVESRRVRCRLTFRQACIAGEIEVGRMLAKRAEAVSRAVDMRSVKVRPELRSSLNDRGHQARGCRGSVRLISRPERLRYPSGNMAPVDPTARQQCVEVLQYSRQDDELVRASYRGDLRAKKRRVVARHTDAAASVDPVRPVARGSCCATTADACDPIPTRGEDTQRRAAPGDLRVRKLRVPFETIVDLDPNDRDRREVVR